MKKSTPKGKKSLKAKKPEKISEEAELPGLDGKEQPLYYYGPPPAIRQLYDAPSGYDKDFHPEDLLKQMREGKTKSEIVASWGITYSDFEDWIDKKPELSQAYAVGMPAFEAYYKSTLRFVAFGQMPKAKDISLQFMLKNFAGFDDSGGGHEFPDAQKTVLEFYDDE